MQSYAFILYCANILATFLWIIFYGFNSGLLRSWNVGMYVAFALGKAWAHMWDGKPGYRVERANACFNQYQ